jgi:hypothetical protein
MTKTSDNHPAKTPPPSTHQLALMIWLCFFPTLTAINLAFGDWLLRTDAVSTAAPRPAPDERPLVLSADGCEG